MKVAALFSGGKDSTYAIYMAKKQGHDVVCLITVIPFSQDSMLMHFPCISITSLQSTSMGLPHLTAKSNSVDTESEYIVLKKLIQRAIDEFKIQGIVHGGILSNFQKKYFENACKEKNLKTLAPIWHVNDSYMQKLLDSNFHFILSSVSSDGLNESWLGKEITHDSLSQLKILSDKHGFNLNFEGGEAETLVLDCPLFDYPIEIQNFEKIWDGYSGKIEILVGGLGYRA